MLTQKQHKQNDPQLRFPNSLMAMRTGADRFFRQLFEEEPAADEAPHQWDAPLAVWSDEDHIFVEMEAPGVCKEAVDISLEGDLLTITAERHSESEGRHFQLNERRHGTVVRVVRLTQMVDDQQVEAKLECGLLSLKLKKLDSAKPKKIEISID